MSKVKHREALDERKAARLEPNWSVATHKYSKTPTKLASHNFVTTAVSGPYASNTHPIKVTSGSNESH